MKIDSVAFSFAGDKYLGVPYSQMDCQAFVERCMADCGFRKDLPGSNAWYREVMNNGWVGSPEDCMKEFGQIPKGALLFILKHDGKEPEKYRKDGIGNASHVGFKTGRNDGAINSSSSRGCVATSKFKDKTIPNGGWNRVGLYKQFDYGKSVNWILEHGTDGQPADDDGKQDEVVYLQGKVTAPTGSTVKLRKEPSTSCSMYWDIQIGTEVMVVDYGPEWSKVITGGLTGWMMTKFIDIQGEVIPGDEEPVDPGQTDIEDDDNFKPSDGSQEYGPGDMVQIQLSYEACANAYPLLRALCDQIEAKVGRG